MKIGLLNGGGDAPGLNAVTRAIVYKADSIGVEIIGIKDGWRGLLDMDTMPLTKEVVEDIHKIGGTILGTSRTNPYKKEGGEERVLQNFRDLGLDGLIAAGGEDTLGVANTLYKKGLKVVGVPKTIDNDLSCTDQTFGFDTAVMIATEAIDRLHSTAKSHHRCMVVEIMGRHAGWITLKAGMAGGAHIILIPEVPFDLDEVCKIIVDRKRAGKGYTLIAVAEGARFKLEGKESDEFLQTQELDEFGHVRLGGIGKALEKILQSKTGVETRSVVLGHLQRGGTPTHFDRNLGTRIGLKALELAIKGEFGKMATLYKGEITSVQLEEAVGRLKTVPIELYEEAKIFFG